MAKIRYELDDWLIVVGLVRRTISSRTYPKLRPDLRLSLSRLKTWS